VPRPAFRAETHPGVSIAVNRLLLAEFVLGLFGRQFGDEALVGRAGELLEQRVVVVVDRLAGFDPDAVPEPPAEHRVVDGVAGLLADDLDQFVLQVRVETDALGDGQSFAVLEFLLAMFVKEVSGRVFDQVD
jgi:hypothetical protein